MNWLRNEIIDGLNLLMVSRLNFKPPLTEFPDLVTAWGDAFFFKSNRQWTEQTHAHRVRHAFRRANAELTDWPAPAAVIALMPPANPIKANNQLEHKRGKMPENIKSLWHTALHEQLAKEEEEKRLRTEEMKNRTAEMFAKVSETLSSEEELGLFKRQFQLMLTAHNSDLTRLLRLILTTEQCLQIKL